MLTIRPFKLFTALSLSPFERYATVPIPSRSGFGGTSLLEAFLLITSSRLVDARNLFEFGTFMGSTTLLLALNSPDDAKVFTLDFDASTAPSIQQHEADAPLTSMHVAASKAQDFMGSSVEPKISILTGDSLKYDFSPLHQKMDWIFVDGGHDLTSVRSDTENAFRMANPSKPSCIAWHDYKNPDADYSDLTRFLDDLSEEKSVFHVADTKLCFWFSDKKMIPALTAG